MNKIESAIFQALTTEYWNRPNYSTSRMATLAIEAAGIPTRDQRAIERIIESNLKVPNFVAMAEEIAAALKGGFTINGTQFHIDEGIHGFIWTTDKDEGEWCKTAYEAQQAAIEFVRGQEEEERIKEAEAWENGGQYAYEREMAAEAARGK